MVDDAICQFCLVVPQCMRLSGTVVEILWSRDVIDHVTTRLPAVDFLWVIHCDHASN